MNPIYFFWALFARSVLRNLVPDHDQWNIVKWISRFSYHYVGLDQLEPLCLHSVCLETGDEVGQPR